LSADPPISRVADDEWLARFIRFSKWIRHSNNTVRQDAFIPPPDLELSVFRHLDLTEEQLWQCGEEIVGIRPEATLHGRADLQAKVVRDQTLEVLPDARSKNHAVIIDWPHDKSKQKIIAIQLAAQCRYVPNPKLVQPE
jgi:hypothetical protein